MKTTMTILSTLVLLLGACSFQDKQQEAQKIETKENMFSKMRTMCLGVKPEQLGLQLSQKETVIFGVVMDWGMDNATASLCSFQTGDASLYLSSGGGIIGGGQHESVKKAAIEFISKSQTYLANAEATKSTDLPSDKEIFFYLLTNKGTFLTKDKMSNIESKKSQLTNLFDEANKVLTQLRLISDK